MTFPSDWPTGCPATDVPQAQGDVFRIVKGDPVTTEDMLSHHETGKMPMADPCRRCGLSVFLVVEDALHQQKLIPRLGTKIAKAVLEAVHGKARQTGTPTHTTWWPFEGVDRAKLFTVVQEVA